MTVLYVVVSALWQCRENYCQLKASRRDSVPFFPRDFLCRAHRRKGAGVLMWGQVREKALGVFDRCLQRGTACL